jgi:hypothetical protein
MRRVAACGLSERTSLCGEGGACAPEAMNAAHPPGFKTANESCATSPPTVSNTAAQADTALVKSRAW